MRGGYRKAVVISGLLNRKSPAIPHALCKPLLEFVRPFLQLGQSGAGTRFEDREVGSQSDPAGRQGKSKHHHGAKSQRIHVLHRVAHVRSN